MSASSKTPDDKMHRYLQRIQKLVGHRGKSPVFNKSRMKSPINVKTPRLDNYLKYEHFFKSVIRFYEIQQRKLKTIFVSQLIDLKITQDQQDEQYNSVTVHIPLLITKKDLLRQVHLIINPLKSCLDNQLKISLQLIKQYSQKIQKRDTKRNHRRTYSEMYAESVTRSHNKSPSTICNYEYKTPQVHKMQSHKDIKLAETKLLCLQLQKLFTRISLCAFAKIRSISIKSLSSQLSHLEKQFYLTQQKLQLAKKQISSTPRRSSFIQKQQQALKKQLQTAYSRVKQLQGELGLILRQLQSTQIQLQTAKKSFYLQKKQSQFNKKQHSSMEKQLLTFKEQLQFQKKQNQAVRKQLLSKQKQLQSARKQNQLKISILQIKYQQLRLNRKDSQVNQRQSQITNKYNKLIQKNQSEISALSKQLERSKSLYFQLQNQLIEAYKSIEKYKIQNFQLNQKQQQLLKEQQLVNDHREEQFQIEHAKNKGFLLIFNLIEGKIKSTKSKCFTAIFQAPKKRSSYVSKCIILQKIFKSIVHSKQKLFFRRIFYQPHNNIPISSQQSNYERLLTSQKTIKSLHSSKHSLSRASIVSSNFDIFVTKINKAFELKHSLHGIYSYVFQKIDYAAFAYLSLSNPLIKITKPTLIEGFRKILFFSFSKSQQNSIHLSFDNSFLSKKSQRIVSFLKKLDNKIVFMKIEAYSLFKLNYELSKKQKIPDESIISQIQLKRELKDFLQQRNRMYEKTFQTWQKTKQMLQDFNIPASHKVHL